MCLRPPRTYQPALLEALLDDLTREGLELPHLQIVCTRLYEALAPGTTVITENHYQSQGRAGGILGDYLRREVEKLGTDASLARAVLNELITSENARQTLSTTELHESLIRRRDLPRLESVLANLVAARLLQRVTIEGMACYELTHEVLIGQIRAWVTPEDWEAKRAREALRRALTNWRAHNWPMDKAALAFVHQRRELLSNLSVEETELLFRSAVAHQCAVGTWARIAHREGIDIWPILQPALTAPDHRVRASVVALLPAVGEAALPALGRVLTDRTPLVRVEAILALERLGTSNARQTLKTNLWYEVYIPPDGNQPGFYIDRYPVTHEQYALFIQDNLDHEPPPTWQGRTAPQHLLDHPVVGVSWQDAQAYAAWAGKRLPTAEEWQRAAGGQQRWRYPSSDEFVSGRCNTRESGERGTTPVGKYSPAGDSPYGVADMGHMLRAHLQSLFGVEVLFLHGGTPQKQRDRIVARFQQAVASSTGAARGSPPIFILSLKAGGTGLNLTAANHVFHFDRWWNPAVEDQATDRTFRIGQTRDVQVHKFICAGTLEERIDELIESKKALAESVVGAGESWLTELSTDELRDIMALRRG